MFVTGIAVSLPGSAFSFVTTSIVAPIPHQVENSRLNVGSVGDTELRVGDDCANIMDGVAANKPSLLNNAADVLCRDKVNTACRTQVVISTKLSRIVYDFNKYLLRPRHGIGSPR